MRKNNNRFQIVVLLALLFATPSSSHEFWIEPRNYIIDPDVLIRADLHVGANFVGPKYPFVPMGYVMAKIGLHDTSSRLEFTGQDDPAFELKPLGEGLHTITLSSRLSRLIHKDFAAFETFAKEVGRADEIQNAARTRPIREGYMRHTKSLISVAGGEGSDFAQGLTYEWVALDNPYTSPRSSTSKLRLQLSFNSTSMPFQPVQVFAREHSSDEEAEAIFLETNANGLLILPADITGEILVNSVKIVEAGEGSDLDWISHWASITFQR